MLFTRAVLFVVIVALSAVRAYAGPPFACCYCTSAASGNQALLCEAFPSSEAVDFQAMCEAKGGDNFACVAAISLDSCPAVFKERGIICPVSSAPVLGSPATAALAAVLLTLGVVVLGTRLRVRPARTRG
jgi:hypothetical protein